MSSPTRHRAARKPAAATYQGQRSKPARTGQPERGQGQVSRSPHQGQSKDHSQGQQARGQGQTSRGQHQGQGAPARGQGQPARGQGPSRTPGKPKRRTTNDRPVRRPALSQLDLALNAAQELPEPEPRTFAQLGLPEAAVRVLNRRGIDSPFAIQARALPDAIAGRDVLARAQTGSGKTLAFGLPMMARLTGDGSARRTLRPRGLVLVPTRELARQVANDLEPVATILGLKIATVFGGAPMGRQIEQLRRGVDVVVATPGRLIDLMERGSVLLDAVEIAVLDEADHMADLGFMPAVTKILDETPQGRQCLLFSATLDRGVDKLVERYLHDPAIHAVAPTPITAENMRHQVFELAHEDKVPVAAQIAGRPARTLFFVRTKHGADRLARQLVNHGVEAAAIHGNLNQGQRQRALDAFASGHSRVLVATDVAARGIHVDDVDLVVHFDPPNDHKDYLHRSGRTARAGATGTVVSLVEPGQVRDVERIHSAASVTPEIARVTDDHPAVHALATSGEPVVVQPLAVPERQPHPGGGGARRPRYNGRAAKRRHANPA
ncbi:MAG TPA: DEAD/DEAH box helicase [Mycobacteriales bacterium]|nr:DEAD/DEAH box helicase [Mycobacteriales bacterium]